MTPEHNTRFDRDDWRPEEAVAALRAHGCRVTKPREAVLRALLESGGTVDAPALAERAAAHQPGIHEATVYRTLNVLAEVGIVTHVHAGHGPSLFRLAGDDGLVAVCTGCGAIEAIPEAAVTDLVATTNDVNGFALDLGHFALEGRCATCQR